MLVCWHLSFRKPSHAGQWAQTGHGNTSYFNYPVAALGWLSDSYVPKYPEANQNLREHSGARLSTANTFDSLAGLAHIFYRSASSSNSVFESEFREIQRLVNVGNAVVDRDRAHFTGVRRKPTATAEAKSLPEPAL